ncbi:L-threonylcarbamoyladenylate synthase [Teredinibacter waterburyi]|uniref:L-threonylcarbamoyladenylate synthase n=1 Tax=Teredinibacter waterburyi TaxID=1500538 RepID=UPI00165F5134|nr:Sua5/YciO/YrdC/YwlC family protein [Teredinibacter waterburyi]
MIYNAHPAIHNACRELLRGGVIAYPTEAVWGLGCDPNNSHALERVLQLKRRHWSKGLILVAATIDQVEFLLDGISTSQRAQLEASWPGPNTWLVPHRQRVSQQLCGDHDTIAVRVSSHPVVKALCEQVGGPIVSTSANPQGLSPARSTTQARRYFGRQGVVFAPGVVGPQKTPSIIRDLTTGAILRG